MRQPAPEGGKCGAVAMWGLWRHCWGHVRNRAVWNTAFTPGDGFNSSFSSFSSFLWGENLETLCRVEPSPRWTLGRAMYGNVGAIRSDGAMLGHSWDIVGTSWHAEPCGGQVGPCVCGRYIGACWGQVGVMLGHVEAVLGLFGVKGEPSWSFLRPCCIIALLHRKKNICCATICCIDYSGVGMEKKTLTIENWVKLEVSEDNDKNRVGIKRWYSCLWWFCITLSVEAGCKDRHVLNQNVLFIAFQWVSEASWAWCFG